MRKRETEWQRKIDREREKEREIGIVTCVCSRVRPRIHRICPARGFLSESGSNFSSPRLIAPISSGWPRPHLFLKKTWKTISSSLGFFLLTEWNRECCWYTFFVSVNFFLCSLYLFFPAAETDVSQPGFSFFGALHRFPLAPQRKSLIYLATCWRYAWGGYKV